MLVKYKGVEFEVEFKHEKKGIAAPRWKSYVLEERLVTTCTIAKVFPGPKHENIELSRGEAICHPQDQFSRAKGRKLALARALKLLCSRAVFSVVSQEPLKLMVVQSKSVRNLRKAFWDAFFANKPTGMQLPAYDEAADADGEAA